MQKLSSNKLLSIITKLLLLTLVAKIMALALVYFLPTQSIEYKRAQSYHSKYQKVNFKNMLEAGKAQTMQRKKRSTTDSASIESLLLKGLYGKRYEGFVIVAKKSMPAKTSIVSVGEIFEGYTLKEIGLTEVIFSKSGMEYVLALDKLSKRKLQKAMMAVKHEPEDSLEKPISREDIAYYTNNSKELWRDIAIAPLKRENKIVGFKVNRIRKGSKMATIGLQKGDIIIQANNVALTSLNAAFNLYNKINTIDTISLIVLRDNQEKEIIYEIH